jgi:uracil-DNA glycosylase
LDSGTTVYPPLNQVFRALSLVDPQSVRVVVLGQDPYHGPGQANGLAFAVNPNVAPPPSLLNIRKAIQNDLLACRNEGKESLMHRPVSWCSGDLEDWTSQGVLLLNDVLTVEGGRPGSHRHWGWPEWTAEVIRALQSSAHGMVWMLWGRDAQQHGSARLRTKNSAQHLILKAPHPSPLSAYRGFLDCRHFSKANQFLASYL